MQVDQHPARRLHHGTQRSVKMLYIGTPARVERVHHVEHRANKHARLRRVGLDVREKAFVVGRNRCERVVLTLSLLFF